MMRTELEFRAAAMRIIILYTSVKGIEATPRTRPSAEDLTSNARAVEDALREAGHSVRCVPFGHDPSALAAKLSRARADVVFNLAESPLESYEKEHHAAALLELLGLPYTGNGPLALALCKNKGRAKDLLRAHGVRTPDYCVFDRVPKRLPVLSFPLVVKPLSEDGSLGINEESVVENPAQLRRSVAHVINTCRQEALAEEFLSGREFNVSLLGNGSRDAPFRVLPPGEYLYHSPRWRVCTFDAKWDERHPSYIAVEAVNPARISQRLKRQLEQMTLDCARIFELSGYARLDFRLDQDGRPHVLEINPNPDVAAPVGIARAAETAGFSYPAFLEELVRLGMAKGAR